MPLHQQMHKKTEKMQTWHCDLFLGKIPHICGGDDDLKCYRYVPSNDTWMLSGSMNYIHKLPAFTFHNDLGLVILGGAYYGTRDRHAKNGSEQVESTIDGETMQVCTT